MLLVGALERYEFQPPGRAAQERGLEAVPPDGDRVSCVQPGDTAVLDHHPGEVRAAEPPENLPLSVRQPVGRLIDEAGLEIVRREGLFVAMWRSGADAWRRGHGMTPLTPQALGSHAVLVAMHPEGMEVVLGEEAAVARIMVAAGPPPATAAMEEDDQSREVWRRMKDLRSLGRRRRMRWSTRRRGWRTGLGPRRGRWKPAGIGPRLGACGWMCAASHTLSRGCRREYPRICS